MRMNFGYCNQRHEDEGKERDDAEDDGGVAYDGEAGVIEKGEEESGDEDGQVAREAGGEDGEDELQVVDAEGGEGGDIDDAAKELPGSHQGTKEGAEGGVGPDHKPAVAGESRAELRGDESFGDAPDEGEYQEA